MLALAMAWELQDQSQTIAIASTIQLVILVVQFEWLIVHSKCATLWCYARFTI